MQVADDVERRKEVTAQSSGAETESKAEVKEVGSRLELEAIPELVGSAANALERARGSRVVGALRGASLNTAELAGALARVEGLCGAVLGGDHVARSTTADAEDWRLVLADHLLALEFLVKGEDGALGGGAKVASAAAARPEDAVVGGRVGRDGREGSSGNFGACLPVVSSTAAAGVEDGGRGNGVGNLVHFDCWWGCLVVKV